MLRRNATEQAMDEPLHSPDLYFQIEKGTARIALQYHRERWRKFLPGEALRFNLPEGRATYGQAFEPEIVADNQVAAARAAKIKFKSINTMLERKIKGGEGIFRSIAPGAAMSEQQNVGRQNRVA